MYSSEYNRSYGGAFGNNYGRGYGNSYEYSSGYGHGYRSGYGNGSSQGYGDPYNAQQQKLASKQEVIQAQDIELSNDTMCRVLTLAEKYALGENKKYGAYNMSSAYGENLLRLFVREIEIFRLSFENIIDEYKEYKFPKNLTKSQILQDINSWDRYVPDESKKYYKYLSDIINGNYKFSLKNEIKKLKEKKKEVQYKEGERARNLQNHVPYISNNTRELAKKAELNYLNNNNYQTEVKLYEKPNQKMLNQLSQDVHNKEDLFDNFYNQ